MLAKTFSGVCITGLACAVPSTIEKTKDHANRFEKRVLDRFTEGTGVVQRHVARPEQTASDLCFAAARELLDKKYINREEIDACIFITQFPDYKIPSTAYVLHHRLELKKDCLSSM